MRGLIRVSEHWFEFRDQIENKFRSSFDEILFIDLPGPSSFYDGLVNFRDTSYITKKILTQLPLAAEIHFVGISLAGLLGLELKSNYSDKFCSLVLINSSHPLLSRLYERINLRAGSKIFLARALSPHFAEIEIAKATINSLELQAKITPSLIKIFKNSPWSINKLIFQLIIATKIKTIPKSTRERQNILIMASKNDRFVSWKSSVALAKSINAEIRVNELAGHDLTTEDPDWCLEQLELFFSQLSKEKESVS